MWLEASEKQSYSLIDPKSIIKIMYKTLIQINLQSKKISFLKNIYLFSKSTSTKHPILSQEKYNSAYSEYLINFSSPKQDKIQHYNTSPLPENIMFLLSLLISIVQYMAISRKAKISPRVSFMRVFLNTYYLIPRLKMHCFSNLVGIASHFIIMGLIYYSLDLLYFASFLLIEMSSYFYGYYVDSLLGNRIFVKTQVIAMSFHYAFDSAFLISMILYDKNIYAIWGLIAFHSILVFSEIYNFSINVKFNFNTPFLSDFQKIYYIGNSNSETFIAAYNQNKQEVSIIRVSRHPQTSKLEHSIKKRRIFDSQIEIEGIDKKRNVLIVSDKTFLIFYSLPYLEFISSTLLYRKNCYRIWDDKGDVAYVHYSKSTQTTDLDILSSQDDFKRGFSLELTANFIQKDQVIHYGSIKIDQNKYEKYIIASNYPSNDIIAINLAKSDIDTLYKKCEKNSIIFKLSEEQLLLYSNQFEPYFIILDVPSQLVGRIQNSQILSGFYPIEVKNLDHHIILHPLTHSRLSNFFLVRIQNNSLHIIERFQVQDTKIQEIYYDPTLKILITLTLNKIFFLNLKNEIIQTNSNDVVSLNISF